MKHLLKPIRLIWIEQNLVIKTVSGQYGPKLPSKRPFGSVYELAKQGLKSYGYYEDFKQYDPGYYFDKYSYKPQKRLAGYLGQKLWSQKKILRNASGNKLNQERSRFNGKYRNYNDSAHYRACKEFTRKYESIRSSKRLYNQSRLGINRFLRPRRIWRPTTYGRVYYQKSWS